MVAVGYGSVYLVWLNQRKARRISISRRSELMAVSYFVYLLTHNRVPEQSLALFGDRQNVDGTDVDKASLASSPLRGKKKMQVGRPQDGLQSLIT